MDLDAGVPFEGAGGDVVGPVVQEDGGVGVEAWEDGVPDLRHDEVLAMIAEIGG